MTNARETPCILAVDCSYAGVALGVRAGGKDFVFESDVPRSSDILAVELQRLIAEAGVGAVDLGRAVVAVGPGSFTGIRLGLAVAEALKVVNARLEIVGVSTLQALAVQVAVQRALEGAAEAFQVVLDAAGGQVYVQGFASNGTALEEARCVPVAEVGEGVVYAPPALMLAGAKALAPLKAETLLGMEARFFMPPAPVYIKPLTYRKVGEV